MVVNKPTPSKIKSKPSSSKKSIKPKSAIQPAPATVTPHTDTTNDVNAINTIVINDNALVPLTTTQPIANDTPAVATNKTITIKSTALKSNTNKGTKPKKPVKSRDAEQPPPVSMDAINNTLNNSNITEQLQTQLNDLKQQIQAETVQYNDTQYTVQQLQQQIQLYTQNKQLLQSQYNIKQTELQRIQSKCNNEREIYKAKLRHFLHENTADWIDSKLTSMTVVQSHLQQYEDQRHTYKHDTNVLTAQQKQLQSEYIQLQHNTNASHEHAVQQLRVDYEQKLEQERYVYEYQCKQIREKLDAESKSDMDELESTKSVEIENLVLSHKQQFEQVQKYFNDIQTSNMELIKSLKSELKECKRKEVSQGRLLQEVQRKAVEISKPLESNHSTIQQLQQQLLVYEKEKSELAQINIETSEYVDKLKSLDWQTEILIQKHVQLQDELKQLKSQYTHAVYDVKQKIDFKTLVLNKKFNTLNVDIEKTNVALYELLSNCGLSNENLSNVKLSLDYILNVKNQQIHEYELQLEGLKRQFQSKINTYKQVCQTNNLSEEVLGLNQQAVTG